jgi:hypothetical protein
LLRRDADQAKRNEACLHHGIEEEQGTLSPRRRLVAAWRTVNSEGDKGSLNGAIQV